MVEQDDIFSLHASLREPTREVEMSLAGYLTACCENPLYYTSPAERMLCAIGEPELVDTSRKPRMGRLTTLFGLTTADMAVVRAVPVPA